MRARKTAAADTVIGAQGRFHALGFPCLHVAGTSWVMITAQPGNSSRALPARAVSTSRSLVGSFEQQPHRRARTGTSTSMPRARTAPISTEPAGRAMLGLLRVISMSRFIWIGEGRSNSPLGPSTPPFARQYFPRCSRTSSISAKRPTASRSWLSRTAPALPGTGCVADDGNVRDGSSASPWCTRDWSTPLQVFSRASSSSTKRPSLRQASRSTRSVSAQS